ncbi:MAG: amidohydrolase family protein [Candidatus Eremiobacteraeota bacterium]|nr:amidohydrolase family protein [Candidatus Eremiobacteraeota bacterium]
MGDASPQDILIRGGQIAAIGHFAIPKDALRLDAGGRTLLPGFIDSHVHLQLSDARQCLRGGTTTVRDLGWTPGVILGRRSALRVSGPDLLAAGGILCPPGGYPSRAGWCPADTAVQVGTPAQAEQAVAAMQASGASIIKVSLPFPQLPEVVRQAHRRGLKVTAHLGGLEELDQALAAGVDELAHFTFSSVRVPEDRIQWMVAHKVAVCPTLHIGASAQRLDNLGRFVKAGGTVLYGTDLGNYGPPPGIDVQELQLMQRAGMTPRQVLDSATSVPARWMGLKDRGAIRVGLRADLILVNGDPLRDLSCLAPPWKVFYGGDEVGQK